MSIMSTIFNARISHRHIEIENMLAQTIDNDDDKKQHYIEGKPYKKINKNTPKNIDLNLMAYHYFEGVDLMAIEGMSYSTVLSLISEVGVDGIKSFLQQNILLLGFDWLRTTKLVEGKCYQAKFRKEVTV